MNLDEFENRLDQNGSRIATWPEDVATAARALLTESAEARRLLEEAKALDGLFAATPAVKAPAGLAGRIVARAMTETNAPAAAVNPAGLHSAAPRSAPPSAPGAAPVIAAASRSSIQAPARWYRELLSPIFGSGSFVRPVATLAICFAAGLGAGYIFNEQGVDSSSYNVMASLFSYLDHT